MNEEIMFCHFCGHSSDLRISETIPDNGHCSVVCGVCNSEGLQWVKSAPDTWLARRSHDRHCREVANLPEWVTGAEMPPGVREQGAEENNYFIADPMTLRTLETGWVDLGKEK